MKTRMQINRRFVIFEALLLVLVLLLSGVGNRLRADSSGNCNGQTINLPFNDVAGNQFFCAIAAAFFSGLTNGTTATTYSPTASITREQMAAFVTRTLDQSLRRGSPRAALQRFWLPAEIGIGFRCAGSSLRLLAADGDDVWVADPVNNEVIRFRGSHARKLGAWTNATQAFGVLALDEHIYVTGKTVPGKLFRINPDGESGGVAVEEASNLGANPEGITFDGQFIWTANSGTEPNTGSISRYHIATKNVTTFAKDFVNPRGIIFDGTFLWVTDSGDNSLKKVITNGAVSAAIPMETGPRYLAFDGANLWVPNFSSNSIRVVRASTGQIMATLTGNGLNGPLSVAFDGERIAVTNNQANGTVSLWRATDFIGLGSFTASNDPTIPVFGICSDGTRFFATNTGGCLSRF